MAMNTKNIPYSDNKIPYNLLLIFLTLGASLILGFLSFGGMFALFPFLGLAFAAFVLSIAYEAEIYLQNNKGALNKLLKHNYLENFLAREYLLTSFPTDINAEDCPQFFKDYAAQLKLLDFFGHKNLNENSKQRKKQIEKTLKDMEKWFALQLFAKDEDKKNEQSAYAQQLRLWLADHQQNDWQVKLRNRQIIFQTVKVFSVLAGIFMGVGTTYLVVEAFSVIPVIATIPFAFWPILIVPMAIIAGAAYGMLTFNAVTDLINNDTLTKWYNKLRDDLAEGLTVRNVFLTITAVLLAALALALTICTAGTWWTIATKARPLFEWMSNIPSFVMGVINPIITGISAFIFNIQNTAESLDLVDEATQVEGNIFEKIRDFFVEGYNHLRATENWFQILNPFRFLIKLTITPLRIIFFLGHLLSIAVTADRMPGVPEILSAIIAIISEGFEDAHYFLGHNHADEDHNHHHGVETLLEEHLDNAHGHNHNLDIPSLILTWLATPLYFLAAAWDYLFSQLNEADSTVTDPDAHSEPHSHSHSHSESHSHSHSHSHSESNSHSHSSNKPKVLDFNQAWNKQLGSKEEKEVEIVADAQRPSKEWQVEHTLSLIEKHKTKYLVDAVIGEDIAKEKSAALDQLHKTIRSSKPESLGDILNQAKTEPVYNKHRLFNQEGVDTRTQTFIDTLPERVQIAAA